MVTVAQFSGRLSRSFGPSAKAAIFLTLGIGGLLAMASSKPESRSQVFGSILFSITWLAIGVWA